MPFVYRERSTETIQKRATQQGGNFQGFILDEFKVYAVKKGENYVRILPPTWDGAEHFGYEVWVHNSIGPDNASMICPYKTDDRHERCPICEAVAAMDRAGDDEAAKVISARKRVVVWMLDRKDPNGFPQLWAMPWTVDRDIAKVSQDRQSGEYYVVDDPERGYDISFDKEGERLQTKYTGIALARKPTSVDPEILEYINEVPVPATILWRTYEEMQDIYSGGIDSEPAPTRRVATNGQGQATVRSGAPRRTLAPSEPQRTQGAIQRAPIQRAPIQRQPVQEAQPQYDEPDPNDPNYQDLGYDPNYAPPDDEYEPPVRQAAPQRGPQRAPLRQPAPQQQAPQRGPAPTNQPTGADRAQSLRERYARR